MDWGGDAGQQGVDAGPARTWWRSDPKLGVTVTFRAPEVTPEVTPEIARMLTVLEGEMNRTEIMEALGLKDERHFREHYQQSAVAAGLVEMTIPDKPKSSKQRYRLTALGEAVRAESIGENRVIRGSKFFPT
jgi:hypothetical protein